MKWMNKLEELLNIPSPTGDTEEAVAFVEKEFKALKVPTERTNKGALLATIKGESEEAITFSAHVDTLGLMVKEVKSNGRLRISKVGGYAWTSVEGEYVTISTLEGKKYTGTVLSTKASTHIFADETNSMKRDDDNMEVRIDEKVKSKEDVEKLGIRVGDFCYLDPRAELTESGFVKSRHLDDKASVIILLMFAEKIMKKGKPKNTINFLISNYEEVGHGAVARIPENTKVFFAVDMANPGPGQESSEYSVTITAKDSSGPYDLALRKELVALAEKHKISYKTDIYNYYGSDASAALRAGYDIRAALVGPGVDASHSMERTHKDAIDETVKLLVAYVEG